MLLSRHVFCEEAHLPRTTRDTEQEAENLAPRIGRPPFILVSSALHMPRAMGLFRRAGVHPIAAPTHHWTLDEPGITLGEVFPSPSAMRKSDAAVHEYRGMIWSRLRGRI